MLLLKLALRPWKLAPASQLLSSVVVGFLLLLAGFMVWMQQALVPVLERLQNEQVITAFIDPSVEAKDSEKILQGVRDSIEISVGAAAVREVKLVEPAQFLEGLKAHYPDLSRELEELGTEMTSVVPRYVSIAGLLNDRTLSEIRTVPGVESAESSRDRFQGVIGAFSALRWVAKLLVLGLAFALLIGLVHLARMNAYVHRDAVALLRLWGAHSATLRVPGVLSALVAGLAGGAIAWFGWITAASWLAGQIRSLSPVLNGLPAAQPALGVSLIAAGAMIGLAAGLFGGTASGRASEPATTKPGARG